MSLFLLFDTMKGSNNIDKKVVDSITKFGGNVEKARHVDFFLYFNNEYDATCVEIELKNLGFETEVNKNSYNDTWGCYAHKKMKVATGRIIDIGNWLEVLAKKHNGIYDGWGSEI